MEKAKTGRPLIDLTGQVIGRVTVLGPTPRETWDAKGRSHWNCRCECGTEWVVRSDKLRFGDVVSCGCWAAEKFVEWTKNNPSPSFVHGLSRTPEWRAWYQARARCTDDRLPHWPNYGGRGITMCQEWMDDFLAFYDHIGPKPSSELSLDRIDNDGNYEPGNVRWATRTEQNNNKRKPVRKPSQSEEDIRSSRLAA